MTLNPQLALEQLKGLPITSIDSAGDMAMFQFGQLHTSPSPRGGTREIGDFALHLQCPWRIVHNASILVGGDDYYVGKVEDGQWVPVDLPMSRFSQIFSTMSQADLTVQEICTDPLGGFKMSFRSGLTLELFPQSSCKGENWRLFSPGTDEPHFVAITVDGHYAPEPPNQKDAELEFGS